MLRRMGVSALLGFVIAVALGCGQKTGDSANVDPKIAEAKKVSQENMRQIATALVEYQNYPGRSIRAGIYAADGKTIGLSWRVAILPALKEDALYKEFKLDEPWDSEHNKKLIAKMPKVFAAPGNPPAEGMTFYRSFVGPETIMPPPPAGKGGEGVPSVEYPFGITDGTPNTALIVEADEAVIWTKPQELEFDRQKPLPKLGGIFADGFHLSFVSTETNFYRQGSLTDETIRAIITPKGGELFTLPGNEPQP